jgi:hypothetical protein
MPLVPCHHIDLVTLNGSLERWGGLATDYPFSKLGRHLLNVVLVEAQFLADLRVGRSRYAEETAAL